ncbi:MAG: hypothetical protein EBR82_19030 [Caulobacteraceae bacterium]|nr:hypothetical protein [Caulobacteraceae bacterium]
MLLHINLHRSVDSDTPFFALVDDELHERLDWYRWMTQTDSMRPFRALYSKEKGCPITESLARHVWAITRGTVPNFIAHANGDLLDCRSSNLIETDSKRKCKIHLSGKTFEPPSARDYRVNHGLPLEGGKKPQGRPLPCTPEQIQKLRALRADVCADMPLSAFNNDVVQEELGRPLSWRGLKKLLA